MIAACLWDLRAQCEEQLRRLTEAQRVADSYRDATGHKSLTRLQLETEIGRVLNANAVIRKASQSCAEMIRELPADDAATPSLSRDNPGGS